MICTRLNAVHLVAILAAGAAAQDDGLQYGENWNKLVKDSDIVAANFPDVDIKLLSPAFLYPDTVPDRFANDTEGPTDDKDVESFIRTLAARNEWMSYEPAKFHSEEGRPINYVHLALPGSDRKDKIRVYVQAGIHGNEPASDQAALAFLGNMDANKTWAESLLEKMDIKLLPRYNLDGVAYFQRQMACNLDPNREHIKLMREQSRNIKRVVSAWSPHIAVDLHEFTAPSIYGGNYQHGADALISGGINLNIHEKIREQVNDVFIPAMGKKLESYDIRWEPYVTGSTNKTKGSKIVFEEAVTGARTGRNAVGLTQAISFLLETRGIRIGDQHFQRRVATGLIKLQTILETARDSAAEVKKTVEDAWEDFINSDDEIVVTDSYVPEKRTFTMIDIENGTVVQAPIDFIRTTPSEANLTRARPEGYLIPRTWFDVAERLEILGLKVEKLDSEFHGTVETLRIATSTPAKKLYEGQFLNTVTTKASSREIVLPVGSFYVSTRQKNAALAFIALEPENEDSYVHFNIVPLSAGDEYPIFRIPRK